MDSTTKLNIEKGKYKNRNLAGSSITESVIKRKRELNEKEEALDFLSNSPSLKIEGASCQTNSMNKNYASSDTDPEEKSSPVAANLRFRSCFSKRNQNEKTPQKEKMTSNIIDDTRRLVIEKNAYFYPKSEDSEIDDEELSQNDSPGIDANFFAAQEKQTFPFPRKGEGMFIKGNPKTFARRTSTLQTGKPQLSTVFETSDSESTTSELFDEKSRPSYNPKSAGDENASFQREKFKRSSRKCKKLFPYHFKCRKTTAEELPVETQTDEESDIHLGLMLQTPSSEELSADAVKRKRRFFYWCCYYSDFRLSRKKVQKSGDLAEQYNLEQYFVGNSKSTLEDIRQWASSFDRMIQSGDGRKAFREYLQMEYSEENIMFWIACEDFKKEKDSDVLKEKARAIYDHFISILSPREVCLDSSVREAVNAAMENPSSHMFDEAQFHIYTLMHRDSYPRFIQSPLYKKLAKLPVPIKSSA